MNNDKKIGKPNKSSRSDTVRQVAKTTAKAAATTAKFSGRVVIGIISLIFRSIGTVILVGILTGLLFTCVFAVYIKTELSSELDVDLSEYTQAQSSVIYYFDNTLSQWQELETLYSEENSVRVAYSDIPLNLVNATIAIEDKRFRTHNGVDWYRTAGAVTHMFMMQDNFGGSTITQQLIKNLTLEDEVTVKRKLTEIFRALEFEKRYSKEEIMEAYLNKIFLGEQCWGVGSAAQVYFGKEVNKLSLAECASLIGITNNPSLYDPYISEKTKERNKNRQLTILQEMLKQGLITKVEHDDAVKEKLVFRNSTREAAAIAAAASGETGKRHYYSWFTDAVIEDVITDIASVKDISRKAATSLLYSAGYQIYTTLNPDLQAMVDEIYIDPANLPDNVSKHEERLSSAIILMDPYNGNIVAMAGGIGEKVGNRLENCATDTTRPPGSSIKPIAVYAPAMDLGYIHPWTLINDSSTGNLLGRKDSWWPRNADYSNRGLVTVATALQSSINTVSAQVLDKLTPQVSYNFMTDKLHVSTLIKAQDGMSDIDYSTLALGQLTYGLTVREAAAAYTMFPNKGMYIESRTYIRILDSSGNTVIENTPESNVAISELTAYHMVEMMKNVVSGGTGSEARLKDITGIPVAGKTGTSGAVGDRWFVGYTPYYLAAVWTGYKNYHDSLPGNMNPSARMFSKVMSLVHQNLEPREFSEPSGLSYVSICEDSGLLATDYCRNDIRGNHVMTLKLHPSERPDRQCTAHIPMDFCKLTLDTLMPDETIVPAGTLTGTVTEFCPAEDIVQMSVLDPSKCAYNVPTPPTTVNYIYGSTSRCYVHPITATMPSPEPEPEPGDEDGEFTEPPDQTPDNPDDNPQSSGLPMPTVPPEDNMPIF
ncbi:MAG: transglycosylase domain-containing protein [Oscillospiraceae bacterium]|nr:transglycosylase domain-containing protein [Oscillospiraceae bacterium]